MAKRDRDTAIWKDPFYRGLPPLYKCFWDFLNDDCDNAGVWCVDFSWAKICIGKKIDPDTALKFFGDRIQVFDFGNKWHVKTFISEKLGFTQLNPSHKFQKSIMDLLVKHKIDKIKGYPDTLQSVISMGKEKGSGQEKDKEKGDEPIIISPATTIEIVPQETFLEQKLSDSLDEIYIDGQRGKWPHLNFDYELQTFCEKVRGSPDEYINRDSNGIRLAFQYQLRNAKSKQPNGTSNNRKQQHTSKLAASVAETYRNVFTGGGNGKGGQPPT